MKFSQYLLSIILAFTIINARVIKRTEDVNNFNSIFNIFSNGFNSLTNNFINWFYSFANYYQATPNALTFMETTANVTVTEDATAYFFDGPGTNKALIFYQGAKVDEKAYSEIMYTLAENGIDCFLVKMPFRIALLGINKASTIMNDPKNVYENWYIAGHSFGGSVAAMYAANHPKEIDGLALLAAYSINRLPEDLKVISITATKDNVLNWNNYHKNKSNLPSNYTEISILGGNHAQFGDYGKQSGDGTAFITMKEQHQKTIKAILEEFN